MAGRRRRLSPGVGVEVVHSLVVELGVALAEGIVNGSFAEGKGVLVRDGVAALGSVGGKQLYDFGCALVVHARGGEDEGVEDVVLAGCVGGVLGHFAVSFGGEDGGR